MILRWLKKLLGRKKGLPVTREDEISELEFVEGLFCAPSTWEFLQKEKENAKQKETNRRI